MSNYDLVMKNNRLYCGEKEASVDLINNKYKRYRFDDFELGIDRCDIDFDELDRPKSLTLFDCSGKILIEREYKDGELYREKDYGVYDSYYHINLYKNGEIIFTEKHN